MSMLLRIRDATDRLTPSEQMLVREIASQPRDAALGTVADLANMAGVHQATASRLARKLGFESYAEFRGALRDEFLTDINPAARVRNTLDETSGTDLLAELIDQEMKALSRLTDYVTPEQIEAAAASLCGARKIFIFASGNAETLAVMMERRLLRFAMNVVRLRGDGRDHAEQLLSLEDEDAVMTFAFRRQPRLYQRIIDHAQGIGAPTIAITGTVGPTLLPAADHLLSAPRGWSIEGFQSLLVPMTICNALLLELARRDEARALGNLEKLGGLIRLFEA